MGCTMASRYDLTNDFSFEVKQRDTDIHIEFSDNDRIDLISYRIYGDPKYWWLILHANGYQLEFDIAPGELLRIPYPLEFALGDINA